MIVCPKHDIKLLLPNRILLHSYHQMLPTWYKISFHGRIRGAIGSFFSIAIVVPADDPDVAKNIIYKQYECLYVSSVEECDEDELIDF